MKVSRLAVGVLLVSAGCVAGVAGTTLANPSPQQAAQSRQAPSLPPPTAAVVRQVLARSVEGPCQASAAQTQLRSPSVPAGRRLVVTSVDVAPGVVIKPGLRLMSVSGEPLIAFVSTIPFYRDLQQGDSGADVRALEAGLVAAGLLRSADDVLGPDSVEVLARLNAAAGVSRQGLDLAHSAAVPTGSSVSGVGVALGQLVTADTTVMTVGASTPQATCLAPSSVPVGVGSDVTVSVGDVKMQVRVTGVTASKDNPELSEITVQGAAAIPDGAQIRLPEGAPTAASLTVPAGALSTSASGRPMVRKVTASGSQDVEVEVGSSAGGWVQVTGVGLAEGDVVELRVAA